MYRGVLALEKRIRTKPIIKTISVDLYHLDIVVQRYGSVNSFIKVFAQKADVEPWSVPESRSRGAMFITHEDTNVAGIWLSDKASFGTVAHEVFHLAHHTLAKYGFKLDYSSEEAYAYLIQYVVNEIMAKLFKWKLQ